MPGRYITVPVQTVADVAMITGRATLLGWSLEEDAASPALANAYLRDGTTSAGAIVAAIKMSASGSSQQWFGDIDNGGITLLTGLYLDWIAGSFSGAIYIG